MMYPEFDKVVGWCQTDRIYGRPQLTQETEIEFAKDLHKLVQVMIKYYQEDYVGLTTKLKSIFDKLEMIAENYPELLDDDIYLTFLSEVLHSGHLPHPEIYCRAMLVSVEEMMSVMALYIEQEGVQNWIVENWEVCKAYKLEIAEQLAQTSTKTPKLVNLCQRHYFLKSSILFLAMIVCGILCWYGIYYWVAALLLIGVFVFMMKEICDYMCISAKQVKNIIWR